MDLILKNARLVGAEDSLNDIGIDKGKIVALSPALSADGETIDLGGWLVSRMRNPRQVCASTMPAWTTRS